MQPHEYPHRILLAVTGLSPQVVTETVYALTQRQTLPFVPTEVHLVTTVKGAERARLTLLSEEPGWFHRLRRDYGLPVIRFDEKHIHVLRDAQGRQLEDIRTQEDNEKAANFITDQVRRLTADDDSALHVSIAGGRKTMGFYVGYALSLFGRAQDRLSHVLVSPRFETNQNFYYVTPRSYVIYTNPPESEPLDAKNAEITLADIPFVRLRQGLPERLLAGKATFSDAVSAAQESVGPPELLIDLENRRVRAGGRIVRLPPVQLAFLSWFARRALAGDSALNCPKDGVPETDYAKAFLSEHQSIIGAMGDNDATRKRLSEGMDKEFFEQTNAKLKALLVQALGHQAHPYLVEGQGSPRRRYALGLQATAICYEPIVATSLPNARTPARVGTVRGSKRRNTTRHASRQPAKQP